VREALQLRSYYRLHLGVHVTCVGTAMPPAKSLDEAAKPLGVPELSLCLVNEEIAMPTPLGVASSFQRASAGTALVLSVLSSFLGVHGCLP
jgi:hypothetical protein